MSSGEATEAKAHAPAAPPRRGSTASIIGRIFLRLTLGVALSFATLLALIASLSLLAEPSTHSVIRAQSEKARFTVASAQQSSFMLGGFRIFGEDDYDGQCVGQALGPNWALEPQLGVEMTYTILRDGRLLVELRGFEDGRESAILRGVGANGRTVTRSAKYDLVLRDDEACGPLQARRLPIWGPGEIGGEPIFRGDGPTATLLSGSLDMYGRATPYVFDPLSWIGLGGEETRRLLAEDDRSIYPSLSNAFQIPPGSRVSTLLGDADPSLRALRGFVIQEDFAFQVEASTESPEVYFFPPGAGKRPDRVKMSLLSQIGNDPNLQRIFQIIVWFVVVLPIAIELIKPLFSRRGETW
ncbi:MAG: hypothetical protein AAGM38_06610 [Pseudomonadota bacterium]